jgi:alpha-galactosidase
MLPTKIVVIGAGSASFGTNTLATMMRDQKLRRSELALVDRNLGTLEIVGSLAERLNHEWQSGMQISLFDRDEDALDGAEFVVLSIEAPHREALWRSDYEIPLRYGVRQPYAENGGPGGFAHAARNIGPVMEIVKHMEQACPDAWLVNFTNPMTRICDAVSRFSKVKVVGLCHQILAGYAMVGKALAKDLDIFVPQGFTSCHASPEFSPLRRQVEAQALEKIQIQAAGLNHFTWMISLHDRRSGKDLYPLFKQRWADLDPSFEPLTRRVYDTFGLFPIPGDEHLCEYLPWASDPLTKPWQKYDLSLYDWDAWAERRDRVHQEMYAMATGELSVDDLLETNSEGASEIIENIAGAGTHYHLAVNLPNMGQIANLPGGAIVETPGIVTGGGVHAVSQGPLPEPVAELCRRELAVGMLCVDAAIHGDRQAALQCLLLDPVITDLEIAENVLDDYLQAYQKYLPQFWN